MTATTKPSEPVPGKDNYYASLKLLGDWFDVDRVRSAKILVVGAGAIGNEVLKNLALLGVGNIFIFDKDRIELSNLPRSVLYRAGDAGRSKAETAAKALRQINPDVGSKGYKGDVRVDLGLGLLRRMDVAIACLDNVAARYELNRDCYKVNRPWIEAGIGQLHGQVRVFRPGHGACYECPFTQADYDQVAESCAQVASEFESEGGVPTMPTIASIVAGVQVQEALKLLDVNRWEGRTLASRVFYFDGRGVEADVLRLPRRADCLGHTTINPELIVELPEATVATTTAAELLSIVRERLGPTADLKLNFDLVVEMLCEGCGARTPVRKPLFKIYRERLICEACGLQSAGYVSELVTTNLLGSARRRYEEDFLDLPLAELGVPPLDILLGRGPHMKGLYFELTGDGPDVMRFQKEQPATV